MVISISGKGMLQNLHVHTDLCYDWLVKPASWKLYLMAVVTLLMHPRPQQAAVIVPSKA